MYENMKILKNNDLDRLQETSYANYVTLRQQIIFITLVSTIIIFCVSLFGLKFEGSIHILSVFTDLLHIFQNNEFYQNIGDIQKAKQYSLEGDMEALDKLCSNQVFFSNRFRFPLLFNNMEKVLIWKILFCLAEVFFNRSSE